MCEPGILGPFQSQCRLETDSKEQLIQSQDKCVDQARGIKFCLLCISSLTLMGP